MHENQQIWMNQPTNRMVANQTRFQNESTVLKQPRGIRKRSSRPPLQPVVRYSQSVMHDNQPIWINRSPHCMVANQTPIQTEFLGPNQQRGNRSKDSQ